MISSELSEKYFRYLSPIDMYKALNEITGLEENKAQVNAIGNRLASLMKKIESKQDIKKLKTEIVCQKLLNVFLILIN